MLASSAYPSSEEDNLCTAIKNSYTKIALKQLAAWPPGTMMMIAVDRDGEDKS